MDTSEKQDKLEKWVANGKFERATRTCETFVAEVRKGLGEGHRETAFWLDALGLCHQREEHNMQAAQCFAKAVGVLQRPENKSCGELAQYLLHLATAEIANGKRPAAEAHFKQAAAIQRGAFAPENAEVTELLDRYADATTGRDEKSTASEAAARAIVMAEFMFGTGYLACRAVETLATSRYRELDHLRAAEILFRWAVTRYQRSLGPEHEIVAEALSLLGNALEELDDFAGAIDAYEERKRIIDRQRDVPALTRIECCEKLADLYKKADNTVQTVAALRNLLEVTEAEHHDSGETAEILDRLGVALLADGKYDDSISMLRRTAAMSAKIHLDDAATLCARYHLGIAYEEKAKHQARATSLPVALRTFQSAFRDARRVFGKKDWFVGEILASQAGVYVALGKDRSAQRSYEEALRIQKAADYVDIDMYEKVNDLARIHLDAKRHPTARRLLRRALALAEAEYGPADSHLHPMLNNLALACAGMGDYDRAISHLQRAITIQESAFGVASTELIDFVQNLAGILALAGRAKEATDNFERALAISRAAGDADPKELKGLEAELAAVKTGRRPKPVGRMWLMEAGASGADKARRVRMTP
jgi:tetratricopeptide (TPR) repeat protein